VGYGAISIRRHNARNGAALSNSSGVALGGIWQLPVPPLRASSSTVAMVSVLVAGLGSYWFHFRRAGAGRVTRTIVMMGLGLGIVAGAVYFVTNIIMFFPSERLYLMQSGFMRFNLFAYSLAQGFSGRADKNRDNHLEPAELYAFLAESMRPRPPGTPKPPGSSSPTTARRAWPTSRWKSARSRAC
jgi:hypothetical protein